MTPFERSVAVSKKHFDMIFKLVEQIKILLTLTDISLQGVVMVEDEWSQAIVELKQQREKARGSAWMIAMEDSGLFDRLDQHITEIDQIFRDFYDRQRENER